MFDLNISKKVTNVNLKKVKSLWKKVEWKIGFEKRSSTNKISWWSKAPQNPRHNIWKQIKRNPPCIW